jgi:hypothetical protein
MESTLCTDGMAAVSFDVLQGFMASAVKPDIEVEEVPCCFVSRNAFIQADSHHSPLYSTDCSAVHKAASSCDELAVVYAASEDVTTSSETSSGNNKTGPNRCTRKRNMQAGSKQGKATRCKVSESAIVIKALMETPDLDEEEYDDEDLAFERGRGGSVSHSTVEKRRRDRINTLIDLLADQVPPLSPKYRHTVSSGEYFCQSNIMAHHPLSSL